MIILYTVVFSKSAALVVVVYIELLLLILSKCSHDVHVQWNLAVMNPKELVCYLFVLSH